jgi:hypothetical protein
MHTVWPQWDKTRTQQQKKQEKILKNLVSKQHVAPWSHQRNKGGNQKVPGI